MVGATASGKSALAMQIAPVIDAEIVAIDSATVYRGMDIGTDKPSVEDRRAIQHHMIDVADPSQTVSVALFQKMARDAISDIHERGKTPLLVGGSGLYFRAVVDPLEFPGTNSEVRRSVEVEAEAIGTDELFNKLKRIDPAAAARIQPSNERRIIRALEVIELTGRPFSSFRVAWDAPTSIYSLAVAGLSVPTEELDERIDRRVDSLFDRGLLDEVKTLEAAGFRSSMTSVQALGYAQILDHFDGQCSLAEAVDLIKKRTRKFARRQLSWFKADPRVKWFESDSVGAAEFIKERHPSVD